MDRMRTAASSEGSQMYLAHESGVSPVKSHSATYR